MTTMSTQAIIQKALDFVGGRQAVLAERSGLSQQYISKLLKNSVTVSARTAIAISRATDGHILISDLVPEVVDAVAAELSKAPTDEDAA